MLKAKLYEIEQDKKRAEIDRQYGEKGDVAWDEDSEARLNRIPYFLRAMVKKGVEKHARENRIPLITIELMEELRKKRFGNDAPVFKF